MPGNADYTRVSRLDRGAGRQAHRDDVLGSVEARRVPGDRGDEVVALDRVEPQAVERADGRGARHVAEQRDLAEELARPELVRLGAVDRHAGPSRLDRVETVTWVSLHEHGVAGHDGHGDR